MHRQGSGRKGGGCGGGGGGAGLGKLISNFRDISVTLINYHSAFSWLYILGQTALAMCISYDRSLIVAYNYPTYGIGIGGGLPWKLADELANFKKITTATKSAPHVPPEFSPINAIVMGRKTWDSMHNRILPHRLNVVITTNSIDLETAYLSDDAAIRPLLLFTTWDAHEHDIGMFLINHNTAAAFAKCYTLDNIFYIGGASIYALALATPHFITNIYITEIYNAGGAECDTYYPHKLQQDNYSESLRLRSISPFQCESGIWYRYMHYCMYYDYMPPDDWRPWRNTGEIAYMDLMRTIAATGIVRGDRTGTGTRSIFGAQLRYDLRDTFPLMTIRGAFMRGIFEELMLYLRGETDNRILQDKKIHIWDGNTSREFLDARGLHDLPPGDMGETYGFNMRHYGGQYKNCRTQYPPDEGFDQLANVIHLLKTEPTSRRILINLWNPATCDRAALPSCLCQYQFYVDTDSNELHLQIYIRSSDYFLANNWNTCTGALFVLLLCHSPGLEHLHPGELIVTIGDAHIYMTHLDKVAETLARTPFPYPKVIIKTRKPITEFTWDDIELIGYRSHPKITGVPMAI